MFYDKVNESAEYIRSKLSEIPKTAIILGSGLGGLVDFMEEKTVVPYKDIPNFPQSSVAGHAGNFVVGKIEGKLVAAMQGRFHYLTKM